MTPDTIREKLLRILQTIQANCGLPCPPLTGTSKPIDDLEGFDSMVWPVAIGMLAAELNIDIADDVNIFASHNGETPLSIDESAALVGKLVEEAGKVTEGAE